MRDELRPIGWHQFERELDWRQGEHVSLIGPTQCGKSTLAARLLSRRTYRAVIATKPKDPIYEQFARDGYRRVKRWSRVRPRERAVILRPEIRDYDDTLDLPRIIGDALHSLYAQGGYCVYVDEARFVCHMLKLTREMQMLWQQGSTLNVSLVATTQRPAHMPLEMYDQPDHLFFWRDTDRVNLTRIGGLAGDIDKVEVKRAVANLPEHKFLYVNTRDGRMLVSEVGGV